MDVLGWFKDIGDAAGPYSNLLGVAIPVLSFTVGGGLVAFLTKIKVIRSRHVAAELRKDLARRDTALAMLGAERDKLHRQLEALKERLPETVIATAEREERDGNYRRSHRLVTDWLEREGGHLAPLFWRRAQWHLTQVAGEERPAAMAMAGAYAAAAEVVDPGFAGPAELIADLQAEWAQSALPNPGLPRARKLLQDYHGPQFEADVLLAADALFVEASGLKDRGRYHLALPAAEMAVAWRTHGLGEKDARTLEARQLRAKILYFLGRYREALAEAQSLSEIKTSSPAFGSDHPVTLESRHLVAQALRSLGRFDEALTAAQDVAAARATVLGPEDADTLGSKMLVAQVLARQERYAEALAMGQDVSAAMAANSRLGPNNPDTLACRHLVAKALARSGRNDEGLAELRSLIETATNLQSLGPDHPLTLGSRFLAAQLLLRLKQYEAALAMARRVAAAMVAGPGHGPVHPETLAAHHLTAQILLALKRYDEALAEAQEAAAGETDCPGLGPDHAETLSTRLLVARILMELGRLTEARDAVQTVTAALSPNTSQSHIQWHLQESSKLLAQITARMAPDTGDAA